jgi:hypothetical protein
VLEVDRNHSGAWRRVFLIAALLAVALKVLVPAGFMVAGPADRSAFPLVICTGQGVVTASDDGAPSAHRSGDGKAQKPSHDAPCVFAGHVAAPAPDPFGVRPVEFVRHTDVSAQSVRRDIAPGRGLAAPPLPARGPPVLIV